jgi:hypothetical protein
MDFIDIHLMSVSHVEPGSFPDKKFLDKFPGHFRVVSIGVDGGGDTPYMMAGVYFNCFESGHVFLL